MAITGGRARRSVAGLALGLFVTVAGAGQGRGEGPQAKDLRRGLVTVYRGTGGGQTVEVTRLEPTVALALRAGEAPHPRLPADALTVTWKGYVNVLRNGDYRFAVRLRGDFKLRVGGKEVLKAACAEKEPALKEGAEVRLESGVHVFVAEFEKAADGGACVELLWQGPEFRREPLPFNLLGHVASAVPPALAADALLEQGRFPFDEASCAPRHHPGHH